MATAAETETTKVKETHSEETDATKATEETSVPAETNRESTAADEDGEPEEKRAKSSDDKVQPVHRPYFSGRQDLPRKAAVLFMYYGGGYYGLQRNATGSYSIEHNTVQTNLRTIEDELLEVLLKCEVITVANFESLKTMQFQRAARTDKNVSALGNVVSAKLRLDRVDTDRLNALLPAQIRVLDVVRTTRSFDAKLSCSHRTYLYFLPTFTLTPVNQFVFLQNTRVDPAQIEKFRAAMRMYIGTHRFHNFTNGKKPTDPSARRYIMDVTVSDAFEREGLECVQVTIKGQSFMLHQIRKMVGLAVAIARGMCDASQIDVARGPLRFDVPKIPGLGLALDAVHYDAYNRRFGSDGAHPPIAFGAYRDRIETFREEVVLKRMLQTERTEHVIWEWLKTLTMHSFQPTDDSARSGIAGTADQNQALKDAITAPIGAVETQAERQATVEEPAVESSNKSEENGSTPSQLAAPVDTPSASAESKAEQTC